MTKTTYTPLFAKYPKPMDSRFYATSMSDLISKDTKYNIPNMFCFVQDEKKFYYLKDGAVGNDSNDWAIIEAADMTFNPYVPSQPYLIGECVRLGSSMYICTTDAAIGESPTNNPEKWLLLGTPEYLQAPIDDTDTITIPHTIVAPHVSVWNTSGFEVDADVQKLSATSIKINFSENFTGYVIIK